MGTWGLAFILVGLSISTNPSWFVLSWVPISLYHCSWVLCRALPDRANIAGCLHQSSSVFTTVMSHWWICHQWPIKMTVCVGVGGCVCACGCECETEGQIFSTFINDYTISFEKRGSVSYTFESWMAWINAMWRDAGFTMICMWRWHISPHATPLADF